jgi:hypothetical protein
VIAQTRGENDIAQASVVFDLKTGQCL